MDRASGGSDRAPVPAVHRYDSVPSTMDVLHGLAERGAAVGTVVVAVEQTAGRGSRGRSWDSRAGGLWMSVLLRPAPAGIALLSLRVGLAVAEALERANPGLGLGLKWPNDLYWGERKVGGVLCEARWAGEMPAWTVVGVGLNLRNPVAAELGPRAGSLTAALSEADPDSLLRLLQPAISALDTSRQHLTPRELSALAWRDWLRGRTLTGPVAGTADGIAADGALVVRRPDGTVVALRAGTVALAEPSDLP